MKLHAVKVIRLSRTLPSNPEFKIISIQMIKSVTSIGANYCEAQSAISKLDFIAKVRISLKESSETTYWLQIIQELLKEPNNNLDNTINESVELERILGRIIKTARTSLKNSNSPGT